jgi:hypothetical protein
MPRISKFGGSRELKAELPVQRLIQLHVSSAPGHRKVPGLFLLVTFCPHARGDDTLDTLLAL